MESKLIVKSFGPLKEVQLELKNVNVFIGPQATGKSALAKLFTIFKAPRKFFDNKNSESNTPPLENESDQQEIINVFRQYNIDSFLTPATEIEFDSELHTITYKNGELKYEPKFLKQVTDLELLANDFNRNRDEIVSKFKILANKFILFDIRAERVLYGDSKSNTPTLSNNWNDLTESNCKDLFDILKTIEDDLSTSTAVYIPAERNFVNIIKKSALNLILNKVPIPQHILSFGAELEKLDLKEIDLSFIQKDLKYKVIDGEDRIYINDKQSIMLTEAASGIQSVVPLLASTLVTKGLVHRSFVIEEPELNLFPIAQYDLINFLESKRKDPFGIWEDYGTIHTYTTHSPYILSSLNNLLYAYKVLSILNGKLSTKEKEGTGIKDNSEKVMKIVKAVINPKTFTAYQICDGFAKSIFNKETGLIEDNYIDMASDKVDDDFNDLMELLK